MKTPKIIRVIFYYSSYTYHVDWSDGNTRTYGMYDTIPSEVHKYIQNCTPRGIMVGNNVVGRVWTK